MQLEKPMTLLELAERQLEESPQWGMCQMTEDQYRFTQEYVYGSFGHSFSNMTPEQASYFILFLAAIQGEI